MDHCIKSQSTSVALLRNVPIAEICRVAMWALANSFLQHYALVHTPWTDTAFGAAVLQTVLDQVSNGVPLGSRMENPYGNYLEKILNLYKNWSFS